MFSFSVLKKLNVRESLKTGTKVAFEEMEHEFPFGTANVENGTTFIEDLHYSWKFSVASIQNVVFNFILDIRLNTLKQLNEVVWT